MNQSTLLLILLLVLLYQSKRKKYSPLQSIKYNANPMGTFGDWIRRPGTFRNVLHLEPDIFLIKIISPLIPSITLPRKYSIRDDYSVIGFVSNLRKCQIEDIDRVIRAIAITRNIPISILSLFYDQSPSTCYKDFHHMVMLFVDKLADQYVSPIIPYSEEYYDKLGQRAFRHFNKCLYSMDIIKVCYVYDYIIIFIYFKQKYYFIIYIIKCSCNCPFDMNHTIYYDGHNHEYNYGYMICVDCDGEARLYNGHLPGSLNDLELYYDSDLHSNSALYLGIDDRILTDGIFVGCDENIFITPICYLDRPITPPESRYNKVQRWDRVIVENYNARLKLGCPIIKNFTFGLDKINGIFVMSLILTNIRIKYQSPLRI